MHSADWLYYRKACPHFSILGHIDTSVARRTEFERIMIMIRNTFAVAALIAFCLLLTGCGGDSSGSGSTGPRPPESIPAPVPAPGSTAPAPTSQADGN